MADEGYAIDWSKKRLGTLASGGLDGIIHIYEPKNSEFSDLKE